VGDPLNVDTRFELGKAEMYAGHPENNLIQGQKILEIDPSSVFGYVAMLQSHLDMGRLDLMWPWYIKAMDYDPTDHEMWAHASLSLQLFGASEWADAYLDRAIDLGAGEPTVLKSLARAYVQRGQADEALAVAREALAAKLDDRWYSKSVFLRLLRNEAFRTGNYDEALSAYRKHRPALFKNSPEIAVTNIYTAADLALLLRRSGQPDAADTLIDAAIDWYEQSQFNGIHGYLTTIGDVQLFALKGDGEKALETLRAAVDAGWVFNWRWHMGNQNLDSIRDEPEFQKIVVGLEEKMATQLAAIKALPDMGELDLRYK
jgi:tetratricopeptide (TPR) repeat protein